MVMISVDPADVVELKRRQLNNAPDPIAAKAQLEQVWMHFRERPQDCPQCLRDYLWHVLGRAL